MTCGRCQHQGAEKFGTYRLADELSSADLRGKGHSWAAVRNQPGVIKGAAQRAVAGLPKIPPSADSVND
jgi:hypothetical protein